MCDKRVDCRDTIRKMNGENAQLLWRFLTVKETFVQARVVTHPNPLGNS